MTRDQFLNRLEEKLFFLVASERKKIIKQYRNIIEEKINIGEIEGEAIKKLGSIDDIVLNVLEEYKNKSEYLENNYLHPIKNNKNTKKLRNSFYDGNLYYDKIRHNERIRNIAIITLIPIIIFTILSYFTLIVLIYIMTKGLYLIGLTILITGFSSLFTYALYYVYKRVILKKTAKLSLLPIISFIIIVGLILSVDYVTGLKYYKDLPSNKFNLTTTLIEKDFTRSIYLARPIKNDSIVIDNTLPDNKVIFELKYYKDFVDYNIIVDEAVQDRIYVKKIYKKVVNILTNQIVEGLKRKEVYAMYKLDDLNIRVIMNENTASRISKV